MIRMEELHLHVGGPGSESTEAWSEEDTNVTDIDRKVQSMQDVVDDATSGHEAGVHSSAHYTSKRIPCCGVKPIPECL